MKMKFLYGVALFALHAATSPVAFAQDAATPLSLARVIELSSSNAPEVRIAATKVLEGNARMLGAAVWALENPKFDLVAGPRGGDGTTIDFEAGLEIPVEFGGRRDQRLAVAAAGVEREKHAAEDTSRQAVALAVAAYYRLLQAEEGERLAGERKTLADEVLRVAGERYSAGDAPKFEVNLARTEAALAASGLSAVQRQAAVARTSLAKALGLASARDLVVVGDLRERRMFDALRATPPPQERSDLKAALADAKVAQAAVSLAQSEQLPEISFRVSIKREGNENIALGGFTMTLPFFNPRKGTLQEARVHQQRSVLVAQARTAAMAVEIEGAQRAYDAAVESVRQIEANALATVRENQSMAAESYRAGKIGLATVLQLRREASETRQAYLERLLEAADAGIELATAYGTWATAN